MDLLIEKINALQDLSLTARLPLDLPQIVVVGSQSSGKSSVLENIVGRDFLPRGTGIVTRRPLILQLIYKKSDHKPDNQINSKTSDNGDSQTETPKNKQDKHKKSKKDTKDPSDTNNLKNSVPENFVDGLGNLTVKSDIKSQSIDILSNINMCDGENSEEYFVFGHTSKIFTNFEEVKAEILAETSRELKNANDVSPKPILLKLFSPRVLPLTLVDLPGLVRVPTADQCLSICSRIEEICRSYLRNKNAIILAVSAANIDIANSDALQLARSVDPQYERTIGVLTKIDLMDRGTDIVRVLANRVIKLRFGFVPVVCRSQIDSNLCLQESLRREAAYFEKHEAYSSKSAYCGTPYLIKKLRHILHAHIKQCVPALQQRIQKQLDKAIFELQRLGSENSSPREVVLQAISEVARAFNDILNGSYEWNAQRSQISDGIFAFESHVNSKISSKKSDDISDPRDLFSLSTSGTNSIHGTFAPNLSGNPSKFANNHHRNSELGFSNNALTGGARLTATFETYSECLKSINPLPLSTSGIYTLLRNSTGCKSHVVFPQAAFERLASSSILQIVQPTKVLVSTVLNEMMNIMHVSCQSTVVQRYPLLQERIASALIKMFRKEAEIVQRIVEILVRWNSEYVCASGIEFENIIKSLSKNDETVIEKDEILDLIPNVDLKPNNDSKTNTMSPESKIANENRFYKDIKLNMLSNYFDASKESSKSAKQGENSLSVSKINFYDSENGLSKKEQTEINILRTFVKTYFDDIRKTIVDQVPKAIMSQLVMKCTEHIQKTLFSEVYESQNIESLVVDSDETIKKRKTLKDTIEALKHAYDVMCTL